MTSSATTVPPSAANEEQPQPVATAAPRRSLPAWLPGTCGMLGFILILELAPRVGVVNPAHFSPVTRMLAALATEATEPAFWAALFATVRGWSLGLVVATAAGLVIGIVIGSVTWLERATASTIEFLRPIPSVALIPLVMLLFGTSMRSTLVLVIYASFWQVLIQVIYGIRDIDPTAAEVARSYHLNASRRLRTLVLPTLLPYAMTGFRLAAAVALILEITGELIIGSPGLGQRIALAHTAGAVDMVYALVLVTGLMGVGINLLTRAIERRVLFWHVSVRGVAA